MRVKSVARLNGDQVASVLAITTRAEAADGVAPLSEQVLIEVRSAGSGDPAVPASHFLAYAGTNLAGYAHLEPGPGREPATAEVVVDPDHRRRGVGTALIKAIEASLVAEGSAGALRLWSHGNLEGARVFAVRDGYSGVRELWTMRRSLRPDSQPLPAVSLPGGFTARRFVVGRDEDAWLHVNARAFAGHAEQGRMTRRDLDLRIAEPWFDATGFILIEDTRGVAPVLAASHWTKVVQGKDPLVSATRGEVYVVGVDPAYQGLGLGRAVTVLGLRHLLDRGLSEAILYVDADNAPAVATYSGLGFTGFSVDVMYSPPVHPGVTRWGDERAEDRGLEG